MLFKYRNNGRQVQTVSGGDDRNSGLHNKHRERGRDHHLCTAAESLHEVGANVGCWESDGRSGFQTTSGEVHWHLKGLCDLCGSLTSLLLQHFILATLYVCPIKRSYRQQELSLFASCVSPAVTE